jgi:hypothetical protein
MERVKNKYIYCGGDNSRILYKKNSESAKERFGYKPIKKKTCLKTWNDKDLEQIIEIEKHGKMHLHKSTTE